MSSPLDATLPDSTPDGDDSGPTIIPGVEVTYRQGPWEIWCEWPQRSRRSGLSSVVRVRYLGADPPVLALSSTNVGLYSSSGKNAVAAAMRKVSQVSDADLIVHSLVEHLLGLYRQAAATTRPVPQPYPGDMFLNYPLWPAIGGTLLVAPSNSFKSFLVPAIAAQTTLGHPILQGNTRLASEPRPILVCDWEAGEPAFAERLYAVLKAANLPLEPCVPYKHLTQPFVEVVDQIADEIARHNYGGVILDSLSASMGASLNEDEPANLFWDAIEHLNAPALITAHKNKEAVAKNRKGPTGSVMHMNRPRMVWDGYRPANTNLIRWECINDNNTGHDGNVLAWRIDIQNTGEHEHRRLHSVTFTAVNPENVTEPPQTGATVTDQMHHILTENGPMMYKELALVLGRPADSVKTLLNRNKSRFRKRDDTRWEAF